MARQPAHGQPPTLPEQDSGHHRRWSIPIGRIFGIQIRVHVTFALIVLLFWWASTAPDGLGLASGMVWLGLIFASVTVHELSHSVVARRRGVGVRAIVLLPIGGVSEMETMPEEPADEFAIAIVGPLTSLAIGIAAFGAAAALELELWPPDLAGGALVSRLAWLNIILAGFNLLPAFPLDGGRVFRSLLERTSDLEGATRRAARTGRFFAFLMMAVGVLFNPWLLVIGVFVYLGASAEEAATIVHHRLEDLRVRDVMRPLPANVPTGVPAVEPDLPLEDALHFLDPQRGAIVVSGTSVIGVLHMRDVRALLEGPTAA